MRILKITGVATDEERTAVREVLAIWEQGGTCPDDLMRRLPVSRLEILIGSELPDDPSEAIIVIENGFVAVHPLDDSEQGTIH